MFSKFNRALFATLATTILFAVPAVTGATTVRLTTTLGAIDVVLYDAAAPRTVANFLAYVNSSAYKNSFIHRSVPGFIIQGGGYVWDDASSSVLGVPQNAPIANEFSTSRSNRRGTIAMAKLGGDPNSATSQWYINLANIAIDLDTANGGYTVFGEVSAASMTVVDAIALLPLVNAGTAFDTLPIIGTIANGIILVAWYAYDTNGNPIWYVATNCPVLATGCEGTLYKFTGGAPRTSAWRNINPAIEVGRVKFTFSDPATGIMNYTVNGVTSSRAITRQVY